MATEVAFAKSFLTLVDSKPTKITADHVEDAHNYPATIPVCFVSLVFLGRQWAFLVILGFHLGERVAERRGVVKGCSSPRWVLRS